MSHQFVRLKRRDIINVARINCQARAKVKLVPNKLLLKMKCLILRVHRRKGKKGRKGRETEGINDGNDSSSSRTTVSAIRTHPR